jgi:glycosyltransferase involved in cell wall biosynthesis
MKLSFLADQVGLGAGGSRFTNGFLQALLTNEDILAKLEAIYILTTQQEKTRHLPLMENSARVRSIARRFPSRLRYTALANLMRWTLPDSDIAHGTFYYVFPAQAKRMVVTMHDLSILRPEYHPAEKRRGASSIMTSVVERSTAIVCPSNAIVMECQRRWVDMKHKFHHIYNGTEQLTHDHIAPPPKLIHDLDSYILTVGTIEPRKNYNGILDAYEYLLCSGIDKAPTLVIIGREGWMCDGIIERIKRLQEIGKVHWLNRLDDVDLVHYYAHASVFTYPSIYEGFGYPPFEAAYAEVPMVVSNVSSVGEIWNTHAYTADPFNPRDLIAGWDWALKLDENERRQVAHKQLKRAREFTWTRCVAEYINLYEQLLSE